MFKFNKYVMKDCFVLGLFCKESDNSEWVFRKEYNTKKNKKKRKNG